MGLLGILLGLALLVWLAFRGWSVLLLAPAAALVAAAFAGEPLLAHWTQTFMGSAARFLAQFFPLFLLGALFGKLMEDSGSVHGHRRLHDRAAGPQRAMLAVVLAGALVTYGGVSLFVAFFVLAPMAQALFRAAAIPAPADAGGDRARHLDLHDVGAAGNAGDPERDPDAVLRHDAVRRARASASSPPPSCWASACGGWRAPRPRRAAPARASATRSSRRRQTQPPTTNSCASAPPTAREFDPAEIHHGQPQRRPRRRSCWRRCRSSSWSCVNLLMSLVVLPRLDAVLPGRGALGRDVARRRSAASGRWRWRSPPPIADRDCRQSSGGCRLCARPWMPAPTPPCCRSLSVASLVGFGAVVAALPAFAVVRDWVLSIGGGPLVSLAVATNVLAALTGSASGGLTIALDALGATYMQLAAEIGHRPGAAASRRRDRRRHARQPAAQRRGGDACSRSAARPIARAISTSSWSAIVGAIIALAAVIVLGSALGSF